MYLIPAIATNTLIIAAPIAETSVTNSEIAETSVAAKAEEIETEAKNEPAAILLFKFFNMIKTPRE